MTTTPEDTQPEPDPPVDPNSTDEPNSVKRQLTGTFYPRTGIVDVAEYEAEIEQQVREAYYKDGEGECIVETGDGRILGFEISVNAVPYTKQDVANAMGDEKYAAAFPEEVDAE